MGKKFLKECMKVKLLVIQLCLTLCDPTDRSLPAFSVHEILQARILEWVAIPVSRGSFQPRDQTWVSCIAGRFFTVWVTREYMPVYAYVLSHFSCVWLGDTMDCNLPASSVHGILQARRLEWVAMPSFRGISISISIYLYIYISVCVYVYIYTYDHFSIQQKLTL